MTTAGRPTRHPAPGTGNTEPVFAVGTGGDPFVYRPRPRRVTMLGYGPKVSLFNSLWQEGRGDAASYGWT